jgi:hypothetical protein
MAKWRWISVGSVFDRREFVSLLGGAAAAWRSRRARSSRRCR